MSEVNALFVTASRLKFKFPTSVGQVSVEDLWDLPLTSARGANLDDTAKVLHKGLKDADEISFVKPAVKKTVELQAKFDIVKYVIDVKMAERDSAAEASEKAAKKQKLLAKLAEKQEQKLDTLSEDEIKAMIEAL